VTKRGERERKREREREGERCDEAVRGRGGVTKQRGREREREREREGERGWVYISYTCMYLRVCRPARFRVQ